MGLPEQEIKCTLTTHEIGHNSQPFSCDLVITVYQHQDNECSCNLGEVTIVPKTLNTLSGLKKCIDVAMEFRKTQAQAQGFDFDYKLTDLRLKNGDYIFREDEIKKALNIS